jgi:hypothetical protein
MSLKEIETIQITRDQLKIVAGRSKLTMDQTKQLLEALLQFVLQQTTLEVEIEMEKIIPVRTGELRDDFLTKLRNSYVQGLILKIFLWSELPYAERVNEMSTFQVRHTGTWFENSGKRAYDKYGRRAYLNDPQAQGNYFTRLVEFTKERIMLNLARGKAAIANGSPLTVREMSAIG